jgi:hypothetical protein
MDYLITGLMLLILGNLIKAEVDIAGIKKDIKHIKSRVCPSEKGGEKE